MTTPAAKTRHFGQLSRLDTVLCLATVLTLAPSVRAASEVPAKAGTNAETHETESLRYVPGRGLLAESKDQDFRLHTRLRVQFQYTLQDRPPSEPEHGVEIRRARLQFSGNTFGQHNKFNLELALSPRDVGKQDGGPQNTPLLSYFAEFDQLRDLTLRIGQYKIPFSRQRVMSSGNLQLVDRSAVNGEFNLDRDIGLDLRSKDLFGLGHLRYAIGVFNGAGRDERQLQKLSDLLFLGRVEVLPLGAFDDYSEGDFARSAKPKLSLGAAYAYNHHAERNRGNRSDRPSDGGTTTYSHAALDVLFKMSGLSFTTEFFLRDGMRQYGEQRLASGELASAEPARNGWGWFSQAGYMLPDIDFEVAARYGQIRSQGNSSIDDLNELGFGFSRYFAGHPLKLQLDWTRLYDPEDFLQGEMFWRAQLQIAL